MQDRLLVLASRTIALVLALAAFGFAACSGDDEEETTSPTQPSRGEAPSAEEPPQGTAPANEPDEEPAAGEPDRGSEEERAAVRAARDYVAALDGRDGGAVCALLAPGVIEEVELPRRRGGCAASLSASIGYRDPRGLPVWEGARVAEVPAVEIDGDSARVVVTTVTEFADREELSIEDDVIYLRRSGERWLIAKPSSSLYRAVGIADVPPSVLSPPPG